VDGRFGREWLCPGRIPGNQPNRRTVNDVFGRASKALALPPLSSKAFRQTYITLSRMAGLSSVHTQDQVGHTSEAMMNVYTRTPAELREAGARQMARVLFLGSQEGGNVGTGVGTGANVES